MTIRDPAMFANIQNFKIVYMVIVLVPILMVYVFSCRQLPSKMTLHHIAMFKNTTSIHCDSFISFFREAGSLRERIASLGTKSFGGLSRWRTLKQFTTGSTLHGNGAVVMGLFTRNGSESLRFPLVFSIRPKTAPRAALGRIGSVRGNREGFVTNQTLEVYRHAAKKRVL